MNTPNTSCLSPRNGVRRAGAGGILSTLIALGAALGCATAGAPAEPPAPPPLGTPASGTPLPDLALHELASGAPLHLEALRGQVVLLDIWASWCAPCREEMPMLDDLARRTATKGIQIVAISVDEDRQAALEFLRMRDRWQLRVAHDPGQEATRALQPPKMPTSYLIDRAGRVRHMHAGFERGDAARIERELLALAEQPAS